MSNILERLAACVDAQGFTTDADVLAPLLVEGRGKFTGNAMALLRPRTTAEVSAIVKICNETGTPIVPQGGNTGNVGGQTPDESGKAILLSLTRMKTHRALDTANNTMTLEAGVTLAEAQGLAADQNRLFPLSLASEGSCTIGGNLATNAGGNAVLRYGNMRDLVLGLEVVLPNGDVLDDLSGLRKDNTGYDLKQLFIGSEGTLGIITAACLKMFPQPAETATAMIAIESPADALTLLDQLQGATGGNLTSFEIMPALAFEFLGKHHPQLRQPFAQGAPWVLLAEASGTNIRAPFEQALSEAKALDIVLANSEAQRKDFWALRETLPGVQKAEGGSIKHDVAVPVSAIPAFLAEASAKAEQMVPGVRVCAFGHIGDGNIHFNLSQPAGADTAEFLARWEEVQHQIHAIVLTHGGTISAEHGIGQLKREALRQMKSAPALAMMREIKKAIDPNNIMNPGKLLPDD